MIQDHLRLWAGSSDRTLVGAGPGNRVVRSFMGWMIGATLCMVGGSYVLWADAGNWPEVTDRPAEGLNAAEVSAKTLPYGPAAYGLELGGIGGAYFLAEPGTLLIEVFKRDLNQASRTTELWAILAGPDRRVIAEAKIPDDGLPRGQLGPQRGVLLRAEVPRKGIYALCITVSQDRYGEAMYWSFRTNCPRYVIETSRGHRDAPHEEPIVLYHPQEWARLCFRPTPQAFRVEVQRRAGDERMPQLINDKNQVAASFSRGEGGLWVAEVAADPSRGALWQVVIPPGESRVEIDGLTRWRPDDPYRDLCYWTVEPAAYIPFVDYRWLLVPYRRVVYLGNAREGAVTFFVHNNSQRLLEVDLHVEEAQDGVSVTVKPPRVQVRPGRAERVLVTCLLEAGVSRGSFHLRVLPSGDTSWSTYSTVEVFAGEGPFTKPFPPPLVLEPYQHENEKWGLLPDYPTENELYFDPANRPFVVAEGDLWTNIEGNWQRLNVGSRTVWAGEGRPVRSVRPVSPKIAFEGEGAIYFLAHVDGVDALVYSDGSRTQWIAVAFPPSPFPASYDIEVFTGHNELAGPPPILRFLRTGRDPKRFWRYFHRLELFVPRKEGDRVLLGEPILLSDQCLGISSHSGSPCCLVSRGEKVHAIWAEATDPAVPLPGTPAYATSFDKSTRTLGKPVLVGYGAPPNDIHNTPAITIDGRGYLHALGGTHGAPFPYARSHAINDTQQGFSEPVPASAGEQTYIGLVCGPDDTLYSAFRLWRRGEPPFPNSHFATLALQQKAAEGDWEKPQILILPPFSEYSVFYHRLTIDRRGRLFLSYDYWSTHWFYRIDHFGRRRVSIFSADGGQTWKFVTTADLLEGL